MTLSVIIPTRNRASLLEQTLASIVFQTLPQKEYEVIVIDNGSTDNTKKICEDIKNQFKNFVYMFDGRPGLHTGRNRGFLESKTNILVYADDDIEAFPTWLEAIKNGFTDEKTVLIGGNNIPKYDSVPEKWIFDLWKTDDFGNNLLTEFSCIDMGNLPKQITPYYVFGCNFAVRKEIISVAKGFHPDGMPDNLLQYRGDGETYISQYIQENKLKTMFYPQASVYHLVSKSRMTQEYIDKIAYRNGISSCFTDLRRHKSKKRAYKSFIKLCIKSYLKNICATQKGMLFLLKHYLFNQKVNAWVHRVDYLTEEGAG